MDRESVSWRGYIPALTTPFDQDGALDLDAARRLHQWVLSQGVHGAIILGTQGEWFSQSQDEKRDLLRTAGETFSGHIPIIAGCNAFTAGQAIQNAKVAADSGFDGILLTPPPYAVPNDAEIFAYYEEVSAASPLPICVYNWPPGTNVDMGQPLLAALAGLDSVVAIKNSTPDMGHFLNVFFSLKDHVRVFGLPMNELGLTLVEHHNADGTMGAGAVLGSDQPGFYDAIWAGDLKSAREKGNKDLALMRAWFNPDYTGKFGSAQSIFKAALNLQGLPGGFPRRPILPISEAGEQQIRQTLVDLGKIPE